MPPQGWGQGADRGCRDAVHRLYHFLDGELDETHRASIRRHLDECPPCLQAFDFEAELRVLVARMCRDQVPESLRGRVFHAIRSDIGRDAGSLEWGGSGPW
ncbi:MAG: mycothiol system anti-sigma-R factor [Actinomycetota bacterium]|nr:mycothiol system anti-sigma-R factor [Actinomycetota bacterium]